MSNLFSILKTIQTQLKAPKSQFNKFGGYKYRKAEDILDAVKPFLDQYNCTLVISDAIKFIGDRYYVEATATLYNCDEPEAQISAKASAKTRLKTNSTRP